MPMMHPPSPTPGTRLRSTLGAAWLAAALVGCGGGGAAAGSPAPAPAPTPAPAPAPQPSGSAGCGQAAKLTTGNQTLMSDGISRSYWLDLPAGYDRNKTYPVIIGLHWRDGSADDVHGWSGYFGLKALYGDTAVFVAPDGLDKGWANPGGRDIRFIRAVINQVQQGSCTDPKRVFATGFSFGGMMSNAIGCEMGDVVRAVAPMAGSLWSGCGTSSNRVAALFVHAMDDNTVPYSAGEEARNTFIARNSCGATTTPIGTNGCVEYQGCTADKPVVWCGFPKGGHWYPNFSAGETKAFFDRF
jgi:polyhydroxybutyrate depolymerase